MVLGLRRQDAEANIRAANGPQAEPRMRRVILMYSTVHSGSYAPCAHKLPSLATVFKQLPRLRRFDHGEA
jgi:hypothetical protein